MTRDWTHRKSSRSPGGTSTNFRYVGHQWEVRLIAERDVDDAMVSEGAHSGDAGGFLAAAHGGRGGEEASVLAPVAAGLPLAAYKEEVKRSVSGTCWMIESKLRPWMRRERVQRTSCVPERLPLSGKVPISGGDAEEEAIVLGELGWVDGGDTAVFWGRVHLLQDFIWEGFLYSKNKVSMLLADMLGAVRID